MKKRSAPLFILDDLIRRGQLAPARRALTDLARRKPERRVRAELAFFAWRLKVPELGLRLLHRLVFPATRSRHAAASEEERLAYAACLVQAGATEEGTALLETIDPKRHPLALFVQATAAASRWDYRRVVPLLQAFLRLPGERYQKLVARVNLAAALVYERRGAKVRPLLAALLEECRRGRHLRLTAALLEIRAILAWEERDWPAMEASLADAKRLLGVQGGLDALYLRKWSAVLALSRRPGDGGAVAELRSVQTEAAAAEQWETARDCDHYLAVLRRDEARLWKTYFGTPFPEYREKLLGDYGEAPAPPAEYLWLPETGEKGGRGLALASLEIGDTSQRLLRVLASDFYRPQRTAALHGSLYRGEHFNPVSSPVRVRQAVRRLRAALLDASLPLVVTERDGAYTLRPTKAVRLSLAAPTPEKDSRAGRLLDTLRKRMAGKDFTAKEAEAALEIPGRTARRLLQEGNSSGELARFGRRRAVRYRFL